MMIPNFKVLFIYPNMFMMNMVPPAISIFSAILKECGYDVDLFDTTYYPTDNEFDSDKKKESSVQVRPFNLAEKGIYPETSNVYDDLSKKVDEFSPDLIAMSCVEDMWPLGVKLLNHIKAKKIPTVVGGVFPTFAPEIVIREESVDMVCRGEGEDALLDLCKKMAAGDDYTNVSNLWVKKDGTLVKNRVKAAGNLNETPMPDFTLFGDKRLYRPMAGKVYRMLPVETHRGCPYSCNFCNSPSQRYFYNNAGPGNHFRKKKIPKIKKEIQFYIDKWKIEYIYFTADTFLAWSYSEFDEFIEMYSDFRLPFWIQTRPETITDYRMKKLKEAGVHRMSIGMEHGNEKFRKKVIKRNVSNAAIINSFKIAAEYSIPVTVNNIVGFPDETRALAQDTIEINAEITVDTTNCYAYVPYHGTSLRDYALSKGYIKEDTVMRCLTGEPVLEMPKFSKKEIMGVMRTLPLYAKFPRSIWPRIALAERFDEEGNRIFDELRNVYAERFFGE